MTISSLEAVVPVESYRLWFESILPSAIERLGPPTPLREACAYALTNGGKRIRPALVKMVGDHLGGNVEQAAIAVEYFHTSSLIADDLPCMDDDDERRGKPATHIAHGEATALLASFALISAGYEEIAADPRAVAAVSEKTGLRGLLGGQYLDLHGGGDIAEMMKMKTASLFELSFQLGWIFGGGDEALLETAEEVGTHAGLIFQIVDDWFDREDGDRINSWVSGEASQLLELEMERLRSLLRKIEMEKVLHLFDNLTQPVFAS